MTEERKQELRQLLKEAMEHVVIRYGYRESLSTGRDVYEKYLQERWRYYGADFFSCSFSAHFTPDITSETIKLKLWEFIREELAQYIEGDNILITVCDIETDSTDKSCLHYYVIPGLDLYFLIVRLLEIAIDRGIEDAISVFDRRSCPKGTQDLFQDVALLDGIELETEVQVFEGVQLIPLPPRKISDEIGHNLFGVSYSVFSIQARNFFGKTLLVINRPGFTIFWKNSEKPFQDGTDINELLFQVEVPDVKFPNSNGVASFTELFCQTLSLVCDVPVRVFHQRWFLAENTSFNPHTEIANVVRLCNPSNRATKVKETDIEKAKSLYHVLDKNPGIREKLRIPIDRWIQSKAGEDPNDKIIDLGIALEALYVTRKDKIERQLCYRGSRYLEENEKLWEDREAEFKAIYDYRSSVLHSRELDEEVKIGKQVIPISDLVPRAEDLCRQSILKIMKDGKYPDWDTLRQNI